MGKAAVLGIILVVIAVALIGMFMSQQGPPPAAPQTPTEAPAEEQTPREAAETPTPAEGPRYAEEIRIAIGIDLDTVDPHGQTTTLVYNIMRHVYETLLWYDEEGNVIPWLATRWEVSDDGLTYTFYLREGVKFHDGSELDAETVCLNVERWINPDARVPLRSQLGPVKGCNAVDKYTVEITLEKPYAPFLRAIASYLMITSRPTLERFGADVITEPVGTGPYRFVRWEKGKEIVLERFEDYWGDVPPTRRLVWQIFPEAGTRLAALRAGDVDAAFLPPASEYPKLKDDPNFKVYSPVTTRVIFIALLPKGPLNDVRVRQAINYAVDKEAIVRNVLFGLGQPLDAPIPPFFFGYCPQEPYEYNPERARQLLAEAGYPNGFRMVLLHPTGRYLNDKQIAEALQGYLGQVGIQVELRTMDWPSYVAEILKPNVDEIGGDAILIGWGPLVADAHFTMYAQFHSKEAPPNGLQLARYSNPEVDRLLDAALSELDEERRRQLYCDAIRIIWRDAPWIFLHAQRYFMATSNKVRDVMVFVDGEEFFFHRAYKEE